MKSNCCNEDWRYPVTDDPTGKNRVIYTECQSYCELTDEQQNQCICIEVSGDNPQCLVHLDLS